jgi:RNA polymerase sigma-70 factor (ECF subfamily)
MAAKIDEQNFLHFYDENVAKIYRYIYFRVGSEQVAQDLSSEAFTRALQYLKGGKFIGNLSAMVYQICRNLIADYFRNKQSLSLSLEQIPEGDLSESEKGLISNAEDCLAFDKIKNGLGLIKEEYQEVIIWHYIDDFEIGEIAQILGRSEGSVRTALSRALKALREALEGHH